MFVGRHEERKGLAILLEAVELLPSDVRLWVAGEGPETGQLRDRYKSERRIEWLGRIEDDELAKRLRGADVFCAPSLHGESFGVVLLEAMAAGVPIVASDLPGYRRVARPGQEGLLVAPGDSKALGAALRDVLDHSDQAERLVTGGQQRVAEFSMSKLANVYTDLYTRVLGGR